MRAAIVIPCLNEERSIIELLDSLRLQDFPKDEFQIVIVDGLSEDKTIELINEYLSVHSLNIKVIQNVKKTTPSALNLGVSASSEPLIIRLDAHSKIGESYISEIVKAFDENADFDVVGPQIEYYPSDSSKIISFVISGFINSKIGNGGTPSRNKLLFPRKVEHTVMSCYRRSVWLELGGYDENLKSNEDFDFDFRANRRGFSVYSLPSPIYYAKARRSLTEFAKQRFRYGYWKAQVLIKNPDSLKLRQLIPIVFTLLITFTLLILPIFIIINIIYSSIILISSLDLLRSTSKAFGVSIFSSSVQILKVSYITHCVWAYGFLWGYLFKRMRRENV